MEYFLVKFSAPILVIIFGAIFKFIYLPKLENKLSEAAGQYNLKKDVLLDTIRIINQNINSQPLEQLDPEKFKGHVPLETVSTDRINSIFSRLYIIFNKDDDILKLISSLLGDTLGGDILVKRGKLINAINKELNIKTGLTNAEEIPFYVNKT